MTFGMVSGVDAEMGVLDKGPHAQGEEAVSGFFAHLFEWAE